MPSETSRRHASDRELGPSSATEGIRHWAARLAADAQPRETYLCLSQIDSRGGLVCRDVARQAPATGVALLLRSAQE